MRRTLIALSLAGLATGAPAAAIAAVKAGHFHGRTDQNRVVDFRVKGGKVVDFVAGVMTFCTTMGDNRFETDAVANVPKIKVKGDGSFKWTGEREHDGQITMSVKGRITGGTAKGTVTLRRPDSHYDASEGMTYFGVCAANDRPWKAKLK